MAKRIVGLERVEWQLLSLWVPASAVGWGIPWAGLWADPLFCSCLWIPALFLGIVGATMGGAMSGAVGGAVVSAAQWLILRTRFRDADRWLPASTAAWIVAEAVVWAADWAMPLAEDGPGLWVESNAVDGAVRGAVVGALIGTAQWLVLHRHIRRSGWWVLASVVGSAVGWVAIWIAAAAWADGRLAVWTSSVAGAIGGIGGGAVYGAITGVVLLILLRGPALESGELDTRRQISPLGGGPKTG